VGRKERSSVKINTKQVRAKLKNEKEIRQIPRTERGARLGQDCGIGEREKYAR